jgi:hypothetical protein
LTQRAILPSVIVGDSAGISTWLAIQLLGIIKRPGTINGPSPRAA